MTMFSTCLAPERSDAVKLAAIDALVTIIVDVRHVHDSGSRRMLTLLQSRKYPWFRSVDVLYQFAPAILQNFSVRQLPTGI